MAKPSTALVCDDDDEARFSIEAFSEVRAVGGVDGSEMVRGVGMPEVEDTLLVAPDILARRCSVVRRGESVECGILKFSIFIYDGPLEHAIYSVPRKGAR